MSTFIGYAFKEYFCPDKNTLVEFLLSIILIPLYIIVLATVLACSCFVIGLAMMTVTFFILPLVGFIDIAILGFASTAILFAVGLMIYDITNFWRTVWYSWKLDELKKSLTSSD